MALNSFKDTVTVGANTQELLEFFVLVDKGRNSGSERLSGFPEVPASSLPKPLPPTSSRDKGCEACFSDARWLTVEYSPLAAATGTRVCGTLQPARVKADPITEMS